MTTIGSATVEWRCCEMTEPVPEKIKRVFFQSHIDEAVQEAVENERRRCMGILMSLARGLNERAVQSREDAHDLTIGLRGTYEKGVVLRARGGAFDEAAGILSRVAHGHEFFG